MRRGHRGPHAVRGDGLGPPIGAPAIASAYHARPPALPGKVFSQADYQRRFTGTSDCDVTDYDHRYRQSFYGQPARLIRLTPGGDQCAVKQAQWTQEPCHQTPVLPV